MTAIKMNPRYWINKDNKILNSLWTKIIYRKEESDIWKRNILMWMYKVKVQRIITNLGVYVMTDAGHNYSKKQKDK